MFHLGGRIGNASAEQGTRLLATAAKLGHAAAAYDLALLYVEGRLFPQDFARAAELFRSAADMGNPEAQYALATLYKEGRGVPKDAVEAIKWHMIAKAGGVGDIPLDTFVGRQTNDVRAAAEKAAKTYIDAIKKAREQHS